MGLAFGPLRRLAPPSPNLGFVHRTPFAYQKGPARGPIWYGGEGGIRTHGTREGTTVFETVPIDHSGTSPQRRCGRVGRPVVSEAARLAQAVEVANPSVRPRGISGA